MFKIFWFTLKQDYKTIWISLSIIAVTLALSSILGSAVGNMQETGIGTVEKAAVYNHLSSPYKEYFDDMIFEGGFDEILEVEQIENADDADKLLEERVYDTIVIAEKIDGRETIKILSVKEESFMFSIGSEFANISNAVMLIQDTGMYTPAIEKQYTNEVLKTEELTGGRPIGTDYYGVQTLLQMSTMLAILGIFTVIDDKSKNISPRIKTVPISNFKIAAARLSANVIYMTSIQVIVAALSKYILGVNWSGNYLVILAAFTLFSLVTMTFAMLTATLTKSTMASIGILIGVGSTLWPRFSGAFSPFTRIGRAGYISPNFHAINAIFSGIYDGSSSIILESLLYLAAMAILLLGIYTLAERRKKYDSI